MTLLQIYQYFESLATKHVELLHDGTLTAGQAIIAAADDKDIEEQIKKLEKDFILVFMPYEKKFYPVKPENYTWDKMVCFMVLKTCSRSTQMEILEAQSSCEEICNDFITQIIEDRTKPDKILSVDLDSFYMDKVGPVADNRYGYICMFSLKDTFDQWVNPARWMTV